MSSLIELKIKNQFEVIKRIDAYIGTTNTKCTIIMSYCTAVIALTLTLLSKLEVSHPTTSTVSIGLFGCLGLITAVICMLMACLTIFPVTFSSPDRNIGKSLIFYGDIAAAKNGSNEYAKRITQVSNEDYLDDLSEQVFTLANIVSKKFWMIQKLSIILCLHFFFISALLVTSIINTLP
ncbi:conserved membrane protein of unknown function [Pseudomonas marincola]|uniref:Pycsar effector protein domain-containing protein n=1 Tax=Pseudomonas marincola TaxID=437900 RepID=A0A653E9G5_9PSED|nr:Pycsar system effector family protein [Pseudomonas marincola]CAE6927096.1 conserved membrane protein of unknown function [Pseudomonas marincola]